jgi:CDGSH-type Zn-finger protein
MGVETKISLREDGPLVVTAPPVLTDGAGAAIETKAVAALCRCGHSRNKPFCDGSHKDAGFSSAPDHSKIRNKAIEYSGEVDGCQVTVSYTPVLCSHAGECQRIALPVFDPSARPWIRPENGSLEGILSVMAACPSGALRVKVADGGPQHLTTGEVGIMVEKDGPYHVSNVPLEAEFNGVGASHAKYVLCRCGLSKNKPFCDGTHHDAGWKDDA